MSKCLCCNYELDDTSINSWHLKCIKSFFGTDAMPDISLDKESLKELIKNNVNNKSVITGVQKKMSLGFSRKSKGRLTILDNPIGYILKSQVKKYDSLPENEHITMCLAEISGISCAPHALIKVNDEYAYITKRIDRKIVNMHASKFAMEDFCQLSLKPTEAKYHSSYERCMKIIDKYSIRPGLDKMDLFIRLVFSFIVGNSDMHLKNISLIETYPKSMQYVLSDAYDLLSVKIAFAEDLDELALTLNGKSRHLTRNDFIKFGVNSGLSKIALNKIIDRFVNLKETYIKIINESMLSDSLKKAYVELISMRISTLAM